MSTIVKRKIEVSNGNAALEIVVQVLRIGIGDKDSSGIGKHLRTSVYSCFFVSLYGSYTAVSVDDNSKRKIFVYGVGNFFLKNKEKINQEYYIEKLVDENKKEYFAGKEIINSDEL